MSLTHAREITRSDALDKAVQAARDAETLLSSHKTPVGARAIGLAHLAEAWADIATAMAMDDNAWIRASLDLTEQERAQRRE